MMNDMESSESAELDSNHRDMNPSFGAGLGGFVVTDQSAVMHQPAEGSFHDPAMRQDIEARSRVGTFDDLNRQFGAKSFDPLCKSFAGVTAIHPENAQPGKPAQHARQKHLATVAFGHIGRSHQNSEHQSQSIHQQMALAAFDAFAGVVAHMPAVPGGLDALTVQNRRGGTAALALGSAHQHAERIMDDRPQMVERPLTENMKNCFPVGKIGGQIAPRAATLNEIQDCINNAAAVLGRASAFGCFGEQGFEIGPLGIGQVGVVFGDFHRLNCATAKDGPQNTQAKSSPFSSSCENIFHQTQSRFFRRALKRNGFIYPHARMQTGD